MKNAILLFGGLFLFLHSFAQTPFNKVIYSAQGIRANNTFLNDNRELFISGNFNSDYSHLTKIDSLGNHLWTKSYDKSDQDQNWSNIYNGDQILLLQDGNYLLTRNLKNDIIGNKNLTYLIKFSENGDLIWSRRVHKNDDTNSGRSFTVQMDNGKILHVGSYSPNGECNILRINSTGILENSMTLVNGAGIYPAALIRDTNSAYIVLKGNTVFESSIVQIDELGDFISAKTIPNIRAEHAVFLMSEMHILGLKSTGERAIISIDYAAATAESHECHQESRNLIGIINNLYTININGGNFGEIEVLNLENQQRSVYNHSAGTVDIHKVDSTHLYFIGNGPVFGVKGPNDDQIGLNYFDNTPPFNLCLSGPVNLPTSIPSVANVFPATYSAVSSPQIILDTLTLSWSDESPQIGNNCVTYFGSLNEFDLSNRVTISPNPAKDYIEIEVDDLTIKSIEITGLKGETFITKAKSDQLSVESLPNGIYFIRLTVDNGIVVTKKLIVQH